jgi:hypothetical protein
MAPMTRSQELDELVGSVEQLLARLPQELTPELADLRDKVDAGIFDAWTAIAREDTKNRTSRFDADPWNALLWAALLAGTTAVVAFQATRPAFRLS